MEAVKEKNITADSLVGHIHAALSASTEMRKVFERQEFKVDKFAQTLISMLDATTHDALGMEMQDNGARVEALKMIAELCEFGGPKAQKTQNLKILLETLGLLKGKSLNMNFSFTKYLYDANGQ